MVAQAWDIRDEVPVFEAHGDVTSERLERIAAKMNRRADEMGDGCPLVIGHTVDGKPEWEQPPIVGYSDRYKVKPGRRGIPTIFCRWKLYPVSTVGEEELTAAEILRRFPRRSVEFLPDDDLLDPIAMLGATTPRQDLALVRSAYPGRRVRYSYPAESAMDLNTFLEALAQLIEQAKAAQAAPPAQVPNQPPAPTQQMANPNQKVRYEHETKAEEEHEARLAEHPKAVEHMAACGECKERYAAIHGCMKKKYDMASADAGYVPSGERERMQHDQQAIRLNQLEAEVKALREENTTSRKKYQRSEREKRLIQLEAEGHVLDRAQELADAEELSDEQWQKHEEKIRHRYQRRPVGGFIRTADLPPPTPRTNDVDQGTADAVARDAARRGVSFAQAMAERNGK